MAGLTRWDTLLSGATALIVAASTPLIGARAADLDVPAADVKDPRFKIESGATLRILRPAKFVDPDETLFRQNSKKFTEATGAAVRVDFVGWEDMRPQTAVAANTGAGPDIIVGFGADPQIYAEKLLPVNDLADYLAAKYGGWHQLALLYSRRWGTNDWLAIPMGGSGGASVYRMSWLKQAGYDSIPNDHEGFLAMAEKLNKAGHPRGYALGHAVGDGNGFANWLLWSHGAALTDEQGKVSLDSKATINALNYAKELYPQMISGTLSWGDPSNNKAYASGDISLTSNGVSIYYVAKNSPDPKLQAIAADTNHQAPPLGVAKQTRNRRWWSMR